MMEKNQYFFYRMTIDEFFFNITGMEMIGDQLTISHGIDPDAICLYWKFT